MQEHGKVYLLTDEEFRELTLKLSRQGFEFNDHERHIDDTDYGRVAVGLYGHAYRTGHTRYIIPIDPRLVGVLGEHFTAEASASDSSPAQDEQEAGSPSA